MLVGDWGSGRSCHGPLVLNLRDVEHDNIREVTNLNPHET